MTTTFCSTATTWDDLIVREPALAVLLAEAQTVRSTAGPDFDAHEAFYGYGAFEVGLKARLSLLVGIHRPDRDAALSTSKAYNLAYQTILDVLEGDEMNAPPMIAVCTAAP